MTIDPNLIALWHCARLANCARLRRKPILREPIAIEQLKAIIDALLPERAAAPPN